MQKQILFEKLNKNVKECTGCGACYNSCGRGAITMQQDAEGFLYPLVDMEKCVNCGLCERACPVIKPSHTNSDTTEVYIAANKEHREKSSSGAIFPALAEVITEQGGSVYAARYDEQFSVIFSKFTQMQEIGSYQGSKYVQADTGLIYRDVRTDLEAGKTVLFVGAACQVAGLYGFLQKDYENLYTMDFICHGVPSPAVFKDYIKELADGKEVLDVNFRNKKYGWRCDTLEVTYRNEEPYVKFEKQDLYFRGFLDAVITRPSCGTCPYTKLPRQSDVTIGDCWGIEKFHNKLNDTGGLSWVLLNSPKGKQLFEKVKPQMSICEKDDIETVKKHNHSVYTPKKPNRNRDWFFELRKRQPVGKALQMALENKHDVGIAGLFSSPNYGCAVSHLSLYHILKSLGYEPLMIERAGRNYYGINDNITEYIKKHYSKYDLAPYIRTRSELRKLNACCDTFMVASDQIWKSLLYEEQGNYYALDFVQDNKRKLAYGTSFGHDYYLGSEKVREEMKYYLKRFDAIGIREDSGVEICRDIFEVPARKVLDPVLTVNKQIFEDLIEESARDDSGYVFSYMLEPNRNKEQVVRKLSETCGLKDINVTGMDVTPSRINGWNLVLERNVKVSDWLYLIKNSSCVVTDSFHGMCFSILFEKPFIVIEHENRGNGRFYSLLRTIGLADRIVKSPTDSAEIERLSKQEIDYGRVNEILVREREDSLQWLAEQLKKPHSTDLSANDIMMRRVCELEEQLAECQNTTSFKLRKKIANGRHAVKEIGAGAVCKILLKKIRFKLFRR